MTTVDGTYSVAASAIAGTSLAICVIKDGVLTGNDVGGARYKGVVSVADGIVQFRVDYTMPPGGALIWGTSTTEVWETRSINHDISAEEWESGKPIYMPREGMYLIFTPVPEEWSAAAGPDGFAVLSTILANADRLWKDRESIGR
ncbi:hypothetical protein [Mesorhizobium sp.]|uniref:hypothetical protein n=1 Tax=Mesorhizobium sp. TaxID=1871066 RepID=UPI000FE67B40|nr:hypothetical protein [Mesorhizobium sp.]RWQ28345.1 MAG: hypothetical protein EOS19_15575 [Mesorhizobium sp.]